MMSLRNVRLSSLLTLRIAKLNNSSLSFVHRDHSLDCIDSKLKIKRRKTYHMKYKTQKKITNLFEIAKTFVCQ